MLVGPMSGGDLVGGVENGIDMLLQSTLARTWDMAFFNSFRERRPDRGVPARLAAEARTYARFAAALARVRPAVVHVKAAEGPNFLQGLMYVLLARASGARTLLQIHGGSFDVWYRDGGPRLQQVIRRGLRLPHEVILLSDYWRDFVRDLGTRRPLRVIPNAVDLRHVQPPTRAGRPPFRVVTIGAIGERKGYFDIVEAARRCADAPVRFAFAGPDEFGGETARLRERIVATGMEDRVELLGAVAGEAKWRLLAAADLFLFPSHAENMPNAILEAMAAGVPIVCSPVGAVRDMVDQRGVRFVPAGDAAAIATAVRETVGDPGALRAMGAVNRAHLESRFALERILPQLDAVYAGGGPCPA